MKHIATICLLALGLSACNTPHPHFAGIDPTTVIVDGSTFDVRVKNLQAEALRTNMEYAPRLGPIGGRATIAMERVSGCKVARITGDAALVRGYLDCGDGALELPQARAPSYDCYSLGGSNIYGDVVLQCDPY